ncbi:hypothetical protein M8J76_016046 [Diaphorina citri]|nr:hypothetical protein M8J75_010030 [Diaphorina citri]KAI5741683.1 hypothetical protein M8J76_016046 [Diaphorina citri]KAI5746200.1 hypothetical protein M8J77_001066 [Diaphorina citri]
MSPKNVPKTEESEDAIEDMNMDREHDTVFETAHMLNELYSADHTSTAPALVPTAMLTYSSYNTSVTSGDQRWNPVDIFKMMFSMTVQS